MGIGKRILATIAGLGVLVGGGVKVLAGQADNVPTPKPPAIHVPADPPVTLPKPPKLPKLPKGLSKVVSKAGCQLKDSSDIDQDARLLYRYGYSDFEVSQMVELAEAAQTDPEVWAYCDENFPHSN